MRLQYTSRMDYATYQVNDMMSREFKRPEGRHPIIRALEKANWYMWKPILIYGFFIGSVNSLEKTETGYELKGPVQLGLEGI